MKTTGQRTNESRNDDKVSREVNIKISINVIELKAVVFSFLILFHKCITQGFSTLALLIFWAR